MGQLEGVSALISGAAGGIGSAIVERFAAHGAHVAAGDQRGRPIVSAPNVLPVELDVTDEVHWTRAVDAARCAVGAKRTGQLGGGRPEGGD